MQMRSGSAQAPFNIPRGCSFSPRALIPPGSLFPSDLPTHRPRVNEGLMEAAPVQRLADLRGTLNYLAATCYYRRRRDIARSQPPRGEEERERKTLRPGDADTARVPCLHSVAARSRGRFRDTEVSPASSYFKREYASVSNSGCYRKRSPDCEQEWREIRYFRFRTRAQEMWNYDQRWLRVCPRHVFV